MKVTLAELDARVRMRLSEQDIKWFTPAMMTRFLNEAQDILASAAPYTASIVTECSIVPGSSTYLLDDRMLKPTKVGLVADNGSVDYYEYEEPEAMDEMKMNRRGVGGVRARYCTYRDESDGTSVELLPTPSDETDRLVVRGYRYPKPLVLSTDATEVPTRLVFILIDYAFWQCKVKDEETGQARDARAQFAEDLLNLKRDRAIKQNNEKTRTRGQRERSG